ncbi:MAG: ribbon-helix-helix protein, CopG family [Deltaproteobacteria bacterium]|nr:ribbon-helix-helix protein, CopG family [Deltaproteobacteria bacterium]
MERTQIYLSRRASEVLAREARRTGRTKSQLIREAIEAVYFGAGRPDDVEKALLASAGAWKGRRLGGAEYVERLRSGRLSARISRAKR